METNNEKPIVLINTNTPGEDFSAMEPDFRVVVPDKEYEGFSQDELERYLPQTEVIMAVSGVDSETIAKALRLKVIIVNGAGYDTIDVAAATALKIPVINIPNITATSTAELALGLMLSLCRRITERDRKIRNSDTCQYPDLFKCGTDMGHTLEGKTLGIVGMGHIGSALASMCRAMGMEVVYHNRNRLPTHKELIARYLSFDELLQKSDVISINCPLTDQTRYMFNRTTFEKMKPGAFLINTARGNIIDMAALTEALLTGHLGGAGLDVFPNEIDIPSELLTMDNVVMTTHIGTNTEEVRQKMADEMCRVARIVCKGEVPRRNLINPEILTEPEGEDDPDD